MASEKMHVRCKVGKNIIFQNKTLLVMYKHHKPFWYQVCNFKHFLKAENSEDSLASSCEEFCIGFHVTQYETGLLLELGPLSPLGLLNIQKKLFNTYLLKY